MARSDQKLAELLSNESFVRWITGKAEPQEREKWRQWEQQDPSHTRLKEQAQKMYKLPMQRVRGADAKEQLARLNNRIDNAERRRLTKRQSRKPTYRWAVAAVMILIIAVIAVISFNNQHETEPEQPLYTTLEVGYGETGALKISDGSKIRLNANSSLRYKPKKFNSNKVEVWLKGEAYFSISNRNNGDTRTFIVHTPEGDVSVLGTKFNVNTNDQHTSVVLEQGKIKLTLRDSLKKFSHEKIINPGQHALLNAVQDTIPVQNIDTSLYTAWLEGKLKFDKSSLREIIQKIENTYGVSITARNSDLLKKRISGSLQNPDLKTLLTGLEKALNIDFEQQSEAKYLVSEV